MNLESAIGHDGVGEPGSSMRGVTGRESTTIYDFNAVNTDEKAGLFKLPVDSENKAKTLNIFSVAQPHMRSFHLSWFGFFCAFCSSFAAPPLVSIIRDNLDMTKTDIGNAAITSVIGSIFSRLAIGSVCDLVGPRYGGAFLLLTTVPCVVATASISSPIGFIIVRLFIGFGLATFVTAQYWMSSMFTSKIVGMANGLAAGWGNMGGGFIQLIMPALQSLIQYTLGAPLFTSWRIAFFIPATLQICAGMLILIFGQDSPDGQYLALAKQGLRKTDSFPKVLFNAVTNYRSFIMMLIYGYCFGVELVVDNNAATYFEDYFGVSIINAGVIAASFGMMNIVSRPLGGILSDFSASRFGMRGRLWVLFTLLLCAGISCIILGKMTSLGGAIAMLIIFSFFCQSSCGGTFGVVPFVSRRSLGIVAGMTGAGGNVGAAITQALFFTTGAYSTDLGFVYMGIMICCASSVILLIWFPQWGGMFFGPSKATSATEEEYYGAEYTSEEKGNNLHSASMKFAANSKQERGGVPYAIDENAKTMEPEV